MHVRVRVKEEANDQVERQKRRGKGAEAAPSKRTRENTERRGPHRGQSGDHEVDYSVNTSEGNREGRIKDEEFRKRKRTIARSKTHRRAREIKGNESVREETHGGGG